MRKVYLFITFLALSLIISETAFTFSSAPPSGKTGAPSEGNCTDCHSGTPVSNSSSLSASFSGTNNTYVPGNSYEFTVTNAANGTLFGFEVTTLDASNSKAGDLMVVDAARTQKLGNLSNKEYMGHTKGGNAAVGGQGVWRVGWTAPPAGTGDVTLHMSSVAANGNGTTAGDVVHLKSLTITEGTNASIEELDQISDLAVINNPGQGITVNWTQRKASHLEMAVYDLNGKKIYSSREYGLGQLSRFIPLSLDGGIYLMSINSDEAFASTKFMVQ